MKKYFGKTMPINIKLRYPTDFSSLFISLKKRRENKSICYYYQI